MDEQPTRRPRYGDARRPWHPDFVEYMYRIVEHANYAGLPCTVDDAGKIDWTIPSNRPKGSKNWDGNARRREWWRERAEAIGVADQKDWLSRTAKTIHPFGAKPCQTCGRVLNLSYAYPTQRAIARFNRYLPEDAALDGTEIVDIYEVIDRLVEDAGFETAVAAVADIFRVGHDVDVPTPEALKELVAEHVVAAEPRGMLSPGAMSNAPDRLDGLHTYNLCCRKKQDTGRTAENLRSYGVDRRAFEQWSEGDWDAANTLMRSVAELGECSACGETRPLTADHVGPISLGFQHSPRMNAVCLPCNSAKNNRMTAADVDQLRRVEQAGEPVISWHAASSWQRLRGEVATDEDALLLSRLLRANQHHFLLLLHQATARGVPDALLQFLSPQYAAERTEFIGLDPVTLQFDEMVKFPRQATYSTSLVARLTRIAFSSLDRYVAKGRRNVYFVSTDDLAEVQGVVDAAFAELVASPTDLRDGLREILVLDPDRQDIRLSALLGDGTALPSHPVIREAFRAYMERVAEVLAARFASGQAFELAVEVGEILDEDGA